MHDYNGHGAWRPRIFRNSKSWCFQLRGERGEVRIKRVERERKLESHVRMIFIEGLEIGILFGKYYVVRVLPVQTSSLVFGIVIAVAD